MKQGETKSKPSKYRYTTDTPVHDKAAWTEEKHSAAVIGICLGFLIGGLVFWTLLWSTR